MEGTTTLSPSVTPSVGYEDAPAAIRWLEDVLGFRTTMLFEEPGGGVAYAQLAWRDGAINVSRRPAAPRLPEPGRASIALTAPDAETVDRHYERARAAGANILVPIEDTFYGSHGFTVQDPEGNLWSVGTPWHNSAAAQALPHRRI